MKNRIFAVCLLVGMLSALLGVQAFAQEESDESIYVYVTISDQNGALVLAREEITVTDRDGDGVYTFDEALYAAHASKYEGGADGYGSEETAFGLSMTKLWGVENGGGYGYYLNHVSPQSLADPVSKGDELNAFVYTDAELFSDMYCFFDQTHVAVDGDEKLVLTLWSYTYDENWNTVKTPVAGATVTIDGKTTSFVTDANGEVALAFDGAGYCVVSACKDGAVLVPPVCAVAVSSSKLPAGDVSLVLWFSLAFVSLSAVLLIKKHARHAL